MELKLPEPDVLMPVALPDFGHQISNTPVTAVISARLSRLYKRGTQFDHSREGV
jgi:hypothetical protein